jgi:hypothetical protein
MRSILAPVAAGLLAVAQSTADAPGLTGRVLDPAGEALPGAAVTADLLGRPPGNRPAFSTSTDAHGRFHLDVSPGGSHLLQVTAPGFAPERIVLDLPPSRAMALPAIALSPETRVRARITLDGGAPVQVPALLGRSFAVDGTPLHVDRGSLVLEPADDGGVTFGPVPRGIAVLGIEAPPLARTRLPDVRVDGSRRLVDIGTVVIRPGAELHVRVTSPDGSPVARTWVSLGDGEAVSPFDGLRRATDEDGRVVFEGLARGRHVLTVRGDPPCRSTSPTYAHEVDVPDGGTRHERVIIGAATLTVRVSSHGQPMRGVRVSVYPVMPEMRRPAWQAAAQGAATETPPPGPLECSGTTDADGQVAIAQVPMGSHHLRVHLLNATWSARLRMPAGPATMSIVLPEHAAAVRVVDAATGTPLAHADVRFEGERARVVAQTTVTGDALLEALPASAGTLTVVANGYEPLTRRLSPLGGPTGVRLRRVPAPAVSCRVVDEHGRPLVGAVVLLQTQDGKNGQVLLTDRFGGASFTRTGTRPVRLCAAAPGYAEASAVVAVSLGPTARTELVLRRVQ